jgi:hypothetical protein
MFGIIDDIEARVLKSKCRWACESADDACDSVYTEIQRDGICTRDICTYKREREREGERERMRERMRERERARAREQARE